MLPAGTAKQMSAILRIRVEENYKLWHLPLCNFYYLVVISLLLKCKTVSVHKLKANGECRHTPLDNPDTIG
jgi:hypothetical protein